VYYMPFVHQGLLIGSAFTVRAQPLNSVADPHVMLPRVDDYACIDTVDTEAERDGAPTRMQGMVLRVIGVVPGYSQVSEENCVWWGGLLLTICPIHQFSDLPSSCHMDFVALRIHCTTSATALNLLYMQPHTWSRSSNSEHSKCSRNCGKCKEPHGYRGVEERSFGVELSERSRLNWTGMSVEVVEERRGRRRIYGSTNSRSSRVNARAEADASTMTGKERFAVEESAKPCSSLVNTSEEVTTFDRSERKKTKIVTWVPNSILHDCTPTWVQ
jgi:hypothetical protein